MDRRKIAMEFTRHFLQLTKKDETMAGGKGSSLAKMFKAGFPVPEGFVILSGAFDYFLEKGKLNGKIKKLLSLIDPGKPGSAKKISNKIADLILNEKIPGKIEKEIKESFRGLNAEFVAVRSSAASEDSGAAAWAGQFETYLKTDKNSLSDNIRKCWAAAFNHKAISYLLKNGFSFGAISMAVVVQCMVEGEVSGIAFSAEPREDDGNKIVIEAGAGSGEAIVSGKSNPDRYEVTKKPLKIARINEQGGTPGQKLKEDDILDIAKLVIKIENHFGFPVDVEWTLKDGDIFILQSRPITAMLSGAARGYTWSNINISEIIPGINPPMVTSTLISVFTPVFSKLLQIPEGVPILKIIKGRGYFNLTVIDKKLKDTLKNDDLSLASLFGNENVKFGSALSNLSFLEKTKMAGFLAKIFINSMISEHGFKKIIAQAREKSEFYNRRISNTEKLSELLKNEKEHFAYINALLSEGFSGLMYRLYSYFLFIFLCEKWLSDKNNEKARLLLSSGGYGIQMMEAFSALWKISRKIKRDAKLLEKFISRGTAIKAERILQGAPDIYNDYRLFLDRYGYRCVKEVDFSVPRWSEDTSFVIDILKNYCRSDDLDNPESRQAEASRSQKIALEAAVRRIGGWKKAVLNFMLDRAKKFQNERERAKAEMVRLLDTERKSLLKIGKQLAEKKILTEPADIFIMTRGELDDFSAKNKDFYAKIVRQRKSDYKKYSKIILPDIIIGEGDTGEFPPNPPCEPSLTLKGTAVSHGVTSGTARVINSIEEISKLMPGDILVTDHTDPCWTPVFVTIKGIITNTGGLLSHASIVAREYGLPAVVSVPDATRIIKDGQSVILDGDKGIIQIEK